MHGLRMRAWGEAYSSTILTPFLLVSTLVLHVSMRPICACALMVAQMELCIQGRVEYVWTGLGPASSMQGGWSAAAMRIY